MVSSELNELKNKINSMHREKSELESRLHEYENRPSEQFDM
jgi:predicted nuclease with TOPRIM domain